MDDKSKENPKKYQNIITQKLRELLGEYEVDILTEYIWHMARNSQSSSFMIGELQDFLGDHTEVFVTWLIKLMGDMKKQKNLDGVENEVGEAEDGLKNKNDISHRDKKYRDLRLKPSGFDKDGVGNRKEFNTGRKHIKSFLSRSRSSSNGRSSLARRKMRKRLREHRSNDRLSETSSPARKFQYRSRSKTRRRERSRSRDRNRSRDRMRSRDKYKRSERRNSTSQGRIIYVDKGDDSKEKKILERNSYSGTFLDKNDLDIEPKYDNHEENVAGEKKKVILKPNPRYARESPMHIMQPIIPQTPKINAPNFNIGNNFGYDLMNNGTYEGAIMSSPNFHVEASYGLPPQRPIEETFSNPNLMNQRYPHNFPTKTYRGKTNIQRTAGITPPVHNNYMNPNRFQTTANANNVTTATTAINYTNPNNAMSNATIPNMIGTHSTALHTNHKMNFNMPNVITVNRGPTTYLEAKNNMYTYNAPQTNVTSSHTFHSSGNVFGKSVNRMTQSNFQGITTHVNPATTETTKVQTKENEGTNGEEKGIEGEIICNEQGLRQTSMNTSDGGGGGGSAGKSTNVIIKIQKKCMFLPNCQYGDKCRYIHPTENCRNWPYCAFGKDCIYIHPEVPCKFGAFCCNYYCNYSHKHVESLPVAELGSTGFFLNKKLVNNATEQVTSKNFDDKVAQISISMPKTPPEMRKDKNRGEYNENEYIQSMLEEERRLTGNANNEVGTKHLVDSPMNRSLNLHDGILKDELDIMNDCNMNQEEREKERKVLSNPNFYCTETNDIEVKLDGFNTGNAVSYNGSDISINRNTSGIIRGEGMDNCFEIVEDPGNRFNIMKNTYMEGGGNQGINNLNNSEPNNNKNNNTQGAIDTTTNNDDNNNNNNNNNNDNNNNNNNTIY